MESKLKDFVQLYTDTWSDTTSSDLLKQTASFITGLLVVDGARAVGIHDHPSKESMLRGIACRLMTVAQRHGMDVSFIYTEWDKNTKQIDAASVEHTQARLLGYVADALYYSANPDSSNASVPIHGALNRLFRLTLALGFPIEALVDVDMVRGGNNA